MQNLLVSENRSSNKIVIKRGKITKISITATLTACIPELFLCFGTPVLSVSGCYFHLASEIKILSSIIQNTYFKHEKLVKKTPVFC